MLEVLTEAEIKTFGNPVKKSHEDSWMSSFHVRVCHDDYDKLQIPATWPVGWKCRDFIRRRPTKLAADSNQGGQAQAGGDPALLKV